MGGRADVRADARTLRQALPILRCCAPPGVYNGATRLRHLAVGCHRARVAAALCCSRMIHRMVIAIAHPSKRVVARELEIFAIASPALPSPAAVLT
jgi:hypothetical protein